MEIPPSVIPLVFFLNKPTYYCDIQRYDNTYDKNLSLCPQNRYFQSITSQVVSHHSTHVRKILTFTCKEIQCKVILLFEKKTVPIKPTSMTTYEDSVLTIPTDKYLLVNSLNLIMAGTSSSGSIYRQACLVKRMLSSVVVTSFKLSASAVFLRIFIQAVKR